ncbi:MAG: cytochrome c oxidase assembly protein [Solirubrobacteraceae bacterium]
MADSLPLGLTWAAFWLHLLGERVAARRTGRPRDRLARRRALTFYAGLLVIVVAIATPIETLSKQLLWTHMIQHVLLLSVAAPLIVLGAPWMSLWRPLPLGMRRALARALVLSPRSAPVRSACRALSRPLVALAVYSANLLAWHLPALYDLALRNTDVHALEHLTFVGFAILLWAQVIASPPFRASLSYPRRVAYLVAAMIPNVALSMLLAFSRSPLYPFYAHLAHRPGGISAITDQQIAAGIMWSFGDLPFAIAIVVLAVHWLNGLDKDAAALTGLTPGSGESRRAVERSADSGTPVAPELPIPAPAATGARAGWRLT